MRRAPGIELSIFGVAKVEGIVPAFDAASPGAAASNGTASRAAYIKAKTDHDDFMALAPVRVGPECRLRARWPRRLPRIPREISRRRPRSPQLAGFCCCVSVENHRSPLQTEPRLEGAGFCHLRMSDSDVPLR